MSSPRIPGAGITGAWISLGSGTTEPLVASAVPRFKDRTLCAAALDRQSDLWLYVAQALAFILCARRRDMEALADFLDVLAENPCRTLRMVEITHPDGGRA
jgi:hypothetical protein